VKKRSRIPPISDLSFRDFLVLPIMARSLVRRIGPSPRLHTSAFSCLIFYSLLFPFCSRMLLIL
jgi:hypothetical protein